MQIKQMLLRGGAAHCKLARERRKVRAELEAHRHERDPEKLSFLVSLAEVQVRHG